MTIIIILISLIDIGGVNFKDSKLSVINMDTIDDDNNHDAISAVYYLKNVQIIPICFFVW